MQYTDWKAKRQKQLLNELAFLPSLSNMSVRKFQYSSLSPAEPQGHHFSFRQPSADSIHPERSSTFRDH